MPIQGQTGVAIPVPEADPLLRAVTARVPAAVREGVPAHVSLLYPFLPADELDDGVVKTLSELFAEQAPLAVEFRECRRRREFVYLPPDPRSGLEELTSELRRLWPDVTPYEGIYEEIEPHVTVALHTTPERAAEIEREVVPGWLPISAELREAWLVVFDGQWQLNRQFPFGIS
jgi:hypothetical protein